MREFDRHLSTPAGYVLPLLYMDATACGGWISEKWQFRRRRLFLVPGNSSIGFRLPLNSLPHVDPLDQSYLVPADPFAEHSALPDPARMARPSDGGGANARRPTSPPVLNAPAPATASAKPAHG